ncbi:ATP-grasp domain-containing protein [Thiofilum flexile]|uniref:ATP-grasp domain-containing protein n=1 Tax=Thiofilum flexile TaxID=125627 RepID=UPI000361C872|nr:ATP-grasp domain-containing protein [Thiofilum flexile]
MRIWFNKTFSSISSVLMCLRQAVDIEPITTIVTHTNTAAPAFLVADEYAVEPKGLMGEAYLKWCLQFCEEQAIDVFWVAKEARFLGGQRDKFAAIGTQLLLVAEPEVLALLGRKGDFYRTLPPEVALVMDNIAVHNKTEFDQAVATLSQQHKSLCIKPSVSVFGLGFRVLDTKRDSITHLVKGVEYEIPLSELRAGMENTPEFPEMLVMENLRGYEWSVDCAGDNGQLLCAIQRRKLAAGLGQLIDNNAEIQGMVERLTQHFKLNGIFNIQFKLGANGPRLLEINTRPSGGFGMACLAGVNLAQLVVQALQGKALSMAPLQYGLRVGEMSMPVILGRNDQDTTVEIEDLES